MMNIKKNLSICVLIFMLSFNSCVNAKELSVNNVMNLIHEIKLLANDFNITANQQTQIQNILLDYLPVMAVNLNNMLNNRAKLINSHSLDNLTNESLITSIADAQGQLLKELIISKELMKRDLLLILNQTQKEFIHNLFHVVIQEGLFQN